MCASPPWGIHHGPGSCDQRVGIMRPVLCSAGTWEKLLSGSIGLRSIKGRRNNRFSSITTASIYETVKDWAGDAGRSGEVCGFIKSFWLNSIGSSWMWRQERDNWWLNSPSASCRNEMEVVHLHTAEGLGHLFFGQILFLPLSKSVVHLTVSIV